MLCALTPGGKLIKHENLPGTQYREIVHIIIPYPNTSVTNMHSPRQCSDDDKTLFPLGSNIMEIPSLNHAH